MKRRVALAVGLLAALLAGVAQVQAQPRSAGPAKGSLLLVGGGINTPAIVEAARRLAGGSQVRWMVIPTAASDGELITWHPPDFIRLSGAPFAILHTRDRAEANSEEFVAPLHSATAVWLAGGRQWRLIDAYGGMAVEHALRGVLDRGGLIAGTSAGATVQGSYLVRGSPWTKAILMSPGHERGFGFLENVAIDQHVIARHRQNDLATAVAAHAGLLGIAIAEATAPVVQHDTMTVIGRDVVLITDGADHNGSPYYALAAGSRFDLAHWAVLRRGP